MMKKLCTIMAIAFGWSAVQGQTWTNIATDPSGDSPGGLDATSLDYWYDAVNDEVQLRITVTNLASYSTGPAADFSFHLPNGLDGGAATGTHWTAPGVQVHKTAAAYCDPGGTAPSNYTFSTWPNGVVITSSMAVLCTDCISVYADVANNWLIYTIAREDIITDTEMGGASATISPIVANVGHDVGWDDNITTSGSMTITMSTGVGEDVAAGSITVGPNPARDQLAIDLGTLGGQFEGADLLNVAGERVAGLPSTAADRVTMDVSGLPAGLYFVELRFNGRSPIARKVMVR